MISFLAVEAPNREEAVVAAKNIWFNKVDVHGWLEAFVAHFQIGQNPSSSSAHYSSTSAHLRVLELVENRVMITCGKIITSKTLRLPLATNLFIPLDLCWS